MRNLKRALSLALASVMLMGMMVVGSSAAGFPDVSNKDNTEAISVLNAVGVMLGDEDTGNFRPEDNVTRNEMAVILAKLILGSDADKYVGTCPFTDVPTWAQKYVAACYDNKIVAGRTESIYDGSAVVTAQEAAAMVLRVLGYEKLESTGTNWAQPVVAKANEIRLFKDVGSSATAPMDRNQVAQLALNALQADMVTTKLSGTVTTPDGTIVNMGEPEYNPILIANETDGENYTGDGAGKGRQQLCEKLYDDDLKLTDNGNDHYGRPGLGWTYKTNKVIATRPESPAITYTAGVKTADAKKDLKGYSIKDNSVTAQIDGADGTPKTNIDDLATYLNAALTGKGVTVTIYADSAKKITNVVAINTYFGKVTKVAEKDDETTVTVNRLAGPVNSAKTFETAAFEKDDYVIYTVGTEGIETMSAAESVDGEITATSGDSYLRLDGTKYEYNENAGAEAGALSSVALGDATIYLDADGNVIYVGEVEAAAEQYFYVKGADLYMNEVSVKAVFSDGTTDVVTISDDTYVKATVTGVGDSATISGDVSFSRKAVAGDDGYKKLSDATYDNVRDEIAKKMISKAFSYTESGKEYKVTGVGTVVGDPTGVELVKGNNKIDTGVTANNSTVYVMTSNGNTYTGYRNVPSMDDVKLVYIEDEDNTGIATLVFVVSGDEQDNENAFWFYVADETDFEKAGTNDKAVYTLNAAYVNGEQTDVKVNQDVKGSITGAGLYKATKANDDEVVTELGSGANAPVPVASMKTKQATYAANGSITIDGVSTSYTYDDETVFVYVDGDKVSVGAASDIIKKDLSAVEGDDITYVYIAETDKDDTYIAKVVYVIADEQAAPVVTVAAPTVTLANGSANAATVASAPNGEVKGSITGYTAGTADQVRLTVAAAASTTVDSVTVTGGTGSSADKFATATDITLNAAGTDLVIKVTVKDNANHSTEYTYTWTVAAAGAASHTHSWGAYSLSGGKHVRTCSGAGVCDATTADKEHTPANGSWVNNDPSQHWHACTGTDCTLEADSKVNHAYTDSYEQNAANKQHTGVCECGAKGTAEACADGDGDKNCDTCSRDMSAD